MTTTPAWLADWTTTGDVGGTTGAGTNPAPLSREDVLALLPEWQQQHTTALDDGDSALEGTDASFRRDAGWPELSVSDQIQLAQAHYLRAIAAALGEATVQIAEVDASLLSITDHVDDLACFAARATRPWWRKILRWR